MKNTPKIRILCILVGALVLATAAISLTVRRSHGPTKVAVISAPPSSRPATTTARAPAPALVTTTTSPPRPTTTVVADLQGRLRSLGYWVGSGNSSLMQQAVMAFQKVEGLKPDGIAGRAVQAALAGAQRPTTSVSGDLIEVDKARQVLFVIRSGVVQWTINTSTGSGKPYWQEGHTYTATTPAGRFTVERAVNGNDKGPLGVLYRPRYFNEGIAVHGYSSVPSYPASHGCVRVSNAAMDWIWANNIMAIGSAVWVH
jgi:lipoprotein-anchoring transpeptidase ErfK/SrfK